MTVSDNSQQAVLRNYDPFALAALEPFGFPAQADVTLLSLSENATYLVGDRATGRTAVLRCTGPDTTRLTRSNQNSPGSRPCAGTRAC